MVGNIKHIYVIQSLKAGEKQTGRELYEDTIKMQIDYKQPENIKMKHHYFEANNKALLIDILEDINANAEYLDGGLLLHFEMHGSADNGLKLADDSFISWIELVDIFRKINIKLCNKLFITMATCYGRYLYRGSDANKKSPFSGYISSSKEVTVGEVMEDFKIIFDYLIFNGNIVDSYLVLDKDKTINSNFFYKDSERVFEDNFASVLLKLRNDPSIKKEILDFAMSESAKAGQPIPDDEMNEFIFNNAMKTTYENHKKAFNFYCY